MTERLKAFLEDRNLTQREFATLMGMSEEHISRLLNDKTPLAPSFIGSFFLAFGSEATVAVFETNGNGEDGAQ